MPAAVLLLLSWDANLLLWQASEGKGNKKGNDKSKESGKQ
jgi:hypothetical protein